MSFVLIVPTINANNQIYKTIKNWNSYATNKEIPIIIVDNGSYEPIEIEKTRSHITVVRLEENVGAIDAFNVGIAKAKELHDPDYYVFIHDDLEIYEAGWDTRIETDIPRFNNVGVFGIGGAIQGVSLNGARHGFASNMKEAEMHGIRTRVSQYAVIFDSFVLGVSKNLLEELNWKVAVEFLYGHFLDRDICVESLVRGYTNLLIPLICDHLSGGSSNTQHYRDWLASKGMSDVELHNKNQKIFSTKWRGKVPLFINPSTGAIK